MKTRLHLHRLFLTVACLPVLSSGVVAPAMGTLDPGFSPAVNGQVHAIATQADGRILVAGRFSSVNGQPRSNIARLNANGTLDSSDSFNTTATVNGRINCLLVQKDGRIVIGGQFNSVNGEPRGGIARLNANGTLDAFASSGGGCGSSSYVSCMALQADGKILIGGNFSQVHGEPRSRFARLNTDGTIEDTQTFSPDIGSNGQVRCIAVQPDGRILVGGILDEGVGHHRSRVVRLLANGSLEGVDSFNTGTGANGQVYSMLVQPDGKILLGGTFSHFNGVCRSGIARLHPNGSLEDATTFHTSLDIEEGFRCMVLQTDGKILVAGSFESHDNDDDGDEGEDETSTSSGCVRLHPDGSLDASFDGAPSSCHDSSIHSLAIQADGQVLIGGTFGSLGGVSRSSLARLLNDPAGQELIADASQVSWLRSGSGPEVDQVTFETSQDDGASWTALGEGVRITDGWRFEGGSIPASAQVRARGRSVSGRQNGSSGLVECTGTPGGVPQMPEIVIEQPEGTVIEDGGSFSFGAVAAGQSSSRVFTIRNTGSGSLTGLGITVDGAHATDFTVTNPPTTPVPGPSGTTTFTVTFTPGGMGQRNATLHLASNDSDENPYDITLTGGGQNSAPTIAVNTPSVTVNEGSSASITGTFADADGNASVTLSASTGVIVKDNSLGTWSWSHVPTDGPGQTQTVTVTATDNAVPASVVTTSFQLNVLNVAPITSPQTVTTLEDSSVNITLTAVDLGADTVVLSISSAPPSAECSVSISGGNAVFTPAANFNGSTSFKYIATDDDGGVSNESVITVNVTPVNDAPSFVKGADQVLRPGTSAAQTVAGWATAIHPGAADEAGQTLGFSVSVSSGAAIFSTPPAVSAAGSLSYVPNGTPGTAQVTLTLSDNGGTANNGQDTSPSQRFTITVLTDYSVTTIGGAMIVTDNGGYSDLLLVSEPAPASILFAAAGRSFSVNGVIVPVGSSGNLTLSAINTITVNATEGANDVTISAFSGLLPGLTVNGGSGNDSVSFTGSILFAPGAHLDVNLQDDAVTHGTDTISVSSGSSLRTSGTGSMTFKASKTLVIGTGASLITENGDLTLEANQQAAPTPGSFIGINLGNVLLQSTGTGAMTVMGRGGDDAAGAQMGVRIHSSTDILGGTSGRVLVQGAGGSSSGPGNVGVLLTGSGSLISSAGADVEVVGVEGGGTNSSGLVIQTSGAITTLPGGGSIILVSDSMNFDGTADIRTQVNGQVSLMPYNPGTPVNLGVATTVVGGLLSLTEAELDRISTGTLAVGSSTCGEVLISTPITRTSQTHFQLSSGDSINLGSGPLGTAGGDVTLSPGPLGGIRPGYAGIDVNAGTGTVRAASGSALAIAINGAAANTGYQQLNVTGGVDLNGAVLSLYGSHVPQQGQSFVIVNNDGTDPVTGTFASLPEGSIISLNGVPVAVSYAGGSGNDVTVSYATPMVDVINASRTVLEGGTVTNAGTFSDLQGNASVTLSASIGTVVGDPGTGTWSWSFTPADINTTVTITATDNSTPPLSSSTTFELIVNNVVPIAMNQSVTLLEDSPGLPISLVAIDPGLDSPVYNVVTPPPSTRGALSAPAGNIVTFVPALNYAGATVFTFNATDPAGATSNTATVSVAITSVNDAPSFNKGADKIHITGTTAQQAFAGWATSINDGDAESIQSFTFVVTEIGNSGIFTTPPAIAAGGGLTYKPNGTSGSATLMVTLMDSGGTANGGVNVSPPQFFTIQVKDDITAPGVTISSPLASAKVSESATGFINITGTASDNKLVDRVEASLNGGPFSTAALTLAPGGLTATYAASVSPVPGINTVSVRCYDAYDNVSTVVTRSFTYVVMRDFDLTITPAAGGTVTFTPLLVGGQAQIGVTYTLKATASTGYFWDYWTAPGVSGAAAESATLTVVMSEGLSVTANFLATPFSAGNYTGLAIAEAGTTPAQRNLGMFTGTLTSTGALTGKVNFGGVNHSFTTIFDKHTGASTGASATLSWNLNLDLTGGTEKITGTVTQSANGDVSMIDADRTVFSNSSFVPASFLNAAGTGNGIYSIVFAAQASQPGLTTAQYPQGDGFAKLTLQPNGTISVAAMLADGTTATASAPLSKYFQMPLALIIQSTSTVTGMTLGGMLQFDTSLPDSDVTGAGLQWFRPAKAGQSYYPLGWAAGVSLDVIGCKYAAIVGSSVLPGLGAADPVNGNATLLISEGQLAASISKNLNISTTNVVTKIPATDASYTLTLTTSTVVGLVGGSFTHSGSATVKPVIKGIILQKGASRGGYGFFLSPIPSGSSGESGGILLLGR